MERKDVSRITMFPFSLVKLIHEPTGISVECKETHSQHKNDEIAWKQLELLVNAQAARGDKDG